MVTVGAARTAAAVNRHHHSHDQRDLNDHNDHEKRKPSIQHHESMVQLVSHEKRLRTGHMKKKVISTKGLLWQPRCAILSPDRLTFTKIEDEEKRAREGGSAVSCTVMGVGWRIFSDTPLHLGSGELWNLVPRQGS